MDTPMEKSIKVTKELHRKLEELGTKTETFDDIIWRLINHYEKTRRKDGP